MSNPPYVYGYQVRFVLEDAKGAAFEVLDALRFDPATGTYRLDYPAIADIISQRERFDGQRYKEVELHNV